MQIKIQSLKQSIICELPNELFEQWHDYYFWAEYIPAVSITETKSKPELIIVTGKKFKWIDNNITITGSEQDIRSTIVIIGTLLEQKRQESRLYQIHGAAIGYGTKGILLIGGMSGLGKTSLAIALQNSPKYQFLADEKFIIDGKKHTIVAGCPISKDNLKTDKASIHHRTTKKAAKISLILFPIITNEPEITAHKYDTLKLFWHLYEESSRDIRGLNFLFNDFTETRNSLDTNDIMNQRLADIKKIADKVPAYYIRGNIASVSRFIHNLMKEST